MYKIAREGGGRDFDARRGVMRVCRELPEVAIRRSGGQSVKRLEWSFRIIHTHTITITIRSIPGKA